MDVCIWISAHFLRLRDLWWWWAIVVVISAHRIPADFDCTGVTCTIVTSEFAGILWALNTTMENAIASIQTCYLKIVDPVLQWKKDIFSVPGLGLIQ